MLFKNSKVGVKIVLAFVAVALLCGAMGVLVEHISSIAKVGMLICLIIISVLIGIYISEKITKPLKRIELMIEEMKKGHFDERLNINTKDEIGHIAQLIDSFANELESNVIGVMNRITAGDFTMRIVFKDEKDEISRSINEAVGTIQNLCRSIHQLQRDITAGELDARGRADDYEGSWNELLLGINVLINALVAPLNMSTEYIGSISKGNIPEKITDTYQGDLGKITSNINNCIDAINSLKDDVQMMVAAATEHRFNVKAATEEHRGDFGKIINGVNDFMDVLNAVRYWFEYILDSIPFPIMVTDMDMNWQHINQAAADAMGLKKYEPLGQPCNKFNCSICNTENCSIQCLREGKPQTSYEQSNMNYQVNTNFIFDASGQKIGHLEIIQEVTAGIKKAAYNENEIERLSENLRKLSRGILDLDFSVNQADAYTEKEEKNFLHINDNLKTAKDTIESIINDVSMLTQSAIEGQLGASVDSEKYSGSWKTLVQGMNNILRTIAEPLNDVAEVMNAISDGNLNVSVKGTYQGAFDNLSKSVNETTDILSNIVSEISRVIVSIADRNLDLNHLDEFKGDFVEISNAINVIISSLNTVMSGIHEATSQVATGSRQLSEASQTLSQGAIEQASAIEQLTNSISEIALQTRKSADDADLATKLAMTAKSHALEGNNQMTGMLKSMENIGESSVNISKIIKVIDDIAFQTNILALNAAVEAARAGQHGKGFAVVAEEVRNLASRSADAAKETTLLIEGSMSKAQAGTIIANETASALSEIVAEIEKSALIIDSIATASNGQANRISRISNGIEQVSKVVQNNSSIAEQSAATSEELSSQAELLNEMVNGFILRGKKVDALPAINVGTLDDLYMKGNVADQKEQKILLGNDNLDKY